MNQIIVDTCKGAIDLDKVESISSLEEEEEFFDCLEEGDNLSLFASEEEEEEFFEILDKQDLLIKQIAAFNIPLSIFHYKGYDSHFFISWYNILSEIFKRINRACPEKKILNLILLVLMFPYMVFTRLGLAIFNQLKIDNKVQTSLEKNKMKEGNKISESIAKRLAYCVLVASISILIIIPILLLFLILTTPALAIFYFLNRKLSHSLIDVLKVSSGLHKNEYQNIEIFLYEIEVSGPSIEYDIEIKFPTQFKQLLRDLRENKDNKSFNMIQNFEHNAILKLPTNIFLKNGLKPLRNEINNVLATSIQGLAKIIEELMKLEKKDITYNKLKELLNEFRLNVVNNIDFKLTTHLIYNAYQVAFIQAIKFQQNKRGGNFLLEDEIKNSLVKQELESQGKELPGEKEVIIRDLKKAGAKVPNVLDDSELPLFKGEWERLIQEGKIPKKTIIDVYKNIYPQETRKILDKIKIEIERLKKEGKTKYDEIYKKLKVVYDEGKNTLTSDDLKRKLENLFKFESSDEEVKQRLVKSVMKKIKCELSILGMLNLMEHFRDLEEEIKGPFSKKSLKGTLEKVNAFIEKVYLEITKYKIQNLFENQARGIENSCKLLERDVPDIVKRITSHRAEIAGCLKQHKFLREIIEENEVLNKYLESEKNERGEKYSSIKLIERHLQNSQEILKALEQLELEKQGLLINKKTINDYREELESREKIKFAVIEDNLMKMFRDETFDEKSIKELLEEAELEFYLAERCIKSPVIKIKNNIKHFCQDLLSPLVDRLASLIINNAPKNNENGFWKIWNSLKVSVNYNLIGWSATVNKDNSSEGKALSVAHDTHKEVDTFLQFFQSNYEGVGTFLGNLFSDDGMTFKNDVWPKVEEHLCGMWYRFFKDVEFKIESRLDEASIKPQRRGTIVTV